MKLVIVGTQSVRGPLPGFRTSVPVVYSSVVDVLLSEGGAHRQQFFVQKQPAVSRSPGDAVLTLHHGVVRIDGGEVTTVYAHKGAFGNIQHLVFPLKCTTFRNGSGYGGIGIPRLVGHHGRIVLRQDAHRRRGLQTQVGLRVSAASDGARHRRSIHGERNRRLGQIIPDFVCKSDSGAIGVGQRLRAVVHIAQAGSFAVSRGREDISGKPLIGLYSHPGHAIPALQCPVGGQRADPEPQGVLGRTRIYVGHANGLDVQPDSLVEAFRHLGLSARGRGTVVGRRNLDGKCTLLSGLHRSGADGVLESCLVHFAAVADKADFIRVDVRLGEHRSFGHGHPVVAGVFLELPIAGDSGQSVHCLLRTELDRPVVSRIGRAAVALLGDFVLQHGLGQNIAVRRAHIGLVPFRDILIGGAAGRSEVVSNCRLHRENSALIRLGRDAEMKLPHRDSAVGVPYGTFANLAGNTIIHGIAKGRITYREGELVRCIGPYRHVHGLLVAHPPRVDVLLGEAATHAENGPITIRCSQVQFALLRQPGERVDQLSGGRGIGRIGGVPVHVGDFEHGVVHRHRGPLLDDFGPLCVGMAVL